jgi:tRNA (cytidine/uridine-2'-O-)-methyltransferase
MSLHVVLVEPEIHWNTGNAGRSCLAAGATLHLVQPLGFSLDEREVRRAGLDYWEHVPLQVWRNWPELDAALPELGEPFFFSTKATRPYWEADFGQRTVLVFGPETRGLPQPLLDNYPQRVFRIPMHSDKIRSLNLSTTIGIALYEVLRQRAIRASPR